MRSINCALVLGLVVLSLPLVSYAAGEVLVPSDQTAPNYGLTPGSSGGSSSTGSGQTQGYSPQPLTTTQPLPYVPVPSAAVPGQITPSMGTGSPMQPGQGTRVVNTPAFPANLSKSNLPNSIDIAVDQKWTANEINIIAEKLNVRPQNVAQVCHRSAKGVVQTSKATSMFDTGVSGKSVASYDGTLTNVLAMVQALCDSSIPLPQDKGVIMKTGDEYVVGLNATRCPFDPGTVAKKIFVTTDENGSSICNMQ